MLFYYYNKIYHSGFFTNDAGQTQGILPAKVIGSLTGNKVQIRFFGGKHDKVRDQIGSVILPEL